MSEALVTYFDTENQTHFINLVSPKVREAVLSIPKEYLEMTEKELVEKVYGDRPESLDRMLRTNFWELYNECFSTGKSMSLSKIVAGVCDISTFQRILSNAGRLSYIVREPSHLQNKIKDIYQALLEEMKVISEMKIPIDKKTGCPDAKLMGLKMKAFEYLDQRIHGALIQRMEVRQKTLQVNVDGNPIPEKKKFQTPEEIDQRLKELEQELQTPLALHEAQDPNTIIMEQVVEESGHVSKEFERTR